MSRVALARRALTSAYLPRDPQTKYGPFPPRALPRFIGTMRRSDSRSALARAGPGARELTCPGGYAQVWHAVAVHVDAMPLDAHQAAVGER